MAELMEVVLSQLINGKSVINRWNYVADGSLGTVSFSFGLAQAFGAFPFQLATDNFQEGTVMRALQNLQHVNAQFISLAVKNVYSVTDFYEVPFPGSVVGEVGTGELMASEIVYPFRTNIVRTDVGRGQKRFSGVAESVVGTGGVFGSGSGTLPFALATAMSEVLTYDDEGVTYTYSPSIVKREKYISRAGGMDLSPRHAYRYYADKETQMALIAQGVSWTAHIKTSTQNSRKD